MPDVVSHGGTHRPEWVGGSDPGCPIGYYEYKLYADAGHPVAALAPTLSVVQVGDGQWIIEIPQDLDGARLVRCHAYVTTAGDVTVTLRRIRPGDTDELMLSTPITIEAPDLSSYDAATPAVIDPANASVQGGDQISTDVLAADGIAAGLGVTYVVAGV
jgi:hypothetical protein